MSRAADSPAAPPEGANWQQQAELTDLEATAGLARALATALRAGDLIVLTGGLGAGKTTFTQSLATALKVSGQVSSPTFVLSRIHRSQAGGPDLVHVDAYRTDAAGLESLDLLDTLPGSVTVVEWGRGLVEQTLLGADGSWLDLELFRDDADGSDPASGEFRTDFAETEEDLIGSGRTAVLRGYGPRWARPPLTA